MVRVIIVGGGVAGLEAARLLSGRVETEVITNSDYYVSGPSRPLILSDEQSLDRITRGYGLIDYTRITKGRIGAIDLDERTLDLDGEKVSYDYLILATGLGYDNKFLGKGRFFNVYDIGKLYDLKNIIWSKNGGVILVSAPKQPYRCAPAPFETILTIDMVLRHRKVRNNFELVFVDGNPKIQPPIVHDVIKGIFEERDIELILDNPVSSVRDGIVILEDGAEIKADVPVVLPPNRANNPVGDGFIEVRSTHDLRIKGYDDVFAVGDVARLPFPKNSEVASISARIAASQILEDLGLGTRLDEAYRFVGWAYAGNPDNLKTRSVRFELEFTADGPRGEKDPEPKEDYTRQKDVWEQAVLRKLFGY